MAAAAVMASGISFGQEAGQTELRNLNNLVVRHHAAVRGARGGQLAAARKQAAADIEKRAAALAALIETDPDAALGMAFSEDLAAELKTAFPESAARIETRRSWTGTLESAVEDNADHTGSRTVHRLRSGGRTFMVYPGNAVQIAASGLVKVTGIEVNGNVAASALTATATTTAINGVSGQQAVLTILVNFPGYKLPTAVDAEYMKGVLYGNSWSTKQNTPDFSVDDFWQQNSDGAASAPFSLSKQVGPFLLASNYNVDSKGASFCDYITMRDAVIAAADPSVTFTAYNRVVIVMPNNGACTWTGVSSIGYWSLPSADGTISASFSWLRADQLATRLSGVQLATHELGHGMGLNHARTREYPGPPRIPLGAIGAAGTLVEYGDNFSTMGTGAGFYGAQHAQQILGWLTPSNYTQVQTAGTYAVSAYETRPATGLVKALRVLRDVASNSWLWIEYRANSGIYDGTLGSQVSFGALIHYEDATTGAYTGLLDFTPSTTSFLDPALVAGQTWTDPYSNLSITANGVAGGVLNVGVSYGSAVCTPGSPTVTLSPSNPTVSAGGSTSITVTVKNNNAAACPIFAYGLTAAQPAGFSGTFSATSLSLAGGATGTAILTETAGSTTGTFALSVTATDSGTGSKSGSTSTNITVAAVCSTSSPTLTLSPANTSLLAGASATLTMSVKNNNSSVCTASAFALTAVQPAGFSGTFSVASLSLAAGATGTATLTEKAGSTTGTFALSVTATATDSATGGKSATGSANFTVTAACAAASPSVSLSPAITSIAAGASAAFTVTVKNNNSSACATAGFNLTAVQPTGFSGTFSASSVSGVASGASTSITITEKAGSTAGTFSLNVTATDTARSTSAGTGTAAITVTTCTLAAPVVTLSPATATITAGGSAAYVVTVKNANSAACGAGTFTLAATQPTGLTGSFSVAMLTLAPGTSGTSKLTEKSGTTKGTLVTTVTATSGSLKATATATTIVQ